MLTVGNYHYIRKDFKTKYPSIFGVTPNEFKKQLELLKNTGTFISPNDLINNYEIVLKSKENYILITFDDGLKEQYDLAMPILNDFDMRAVFFVNSSNIEEAKISSVHKIHLLRSIIDSKIIISAINKKQTINLSFADKATAQKIYRYDSKKDSELKYLLNYKLSFSLKEDIVNELFEKYFSENEILNKLYMTKNQIKDLASKGCIGSHSHNHLPLGLLKREIIEFELKHSKMFLEEMTGEKIEMVAYPYGSNEACTEEVATIANKIGYKLGFTVNRDINLNNQNYLLLNRFNCNDIIGGKNYGN